MFKKQGQAAATTTQPKESSSEYETDSSEEEEESEDEPAPPPKPMYRPTFVSKSQRATVKARDDQVAAEAAAEQAREAEAAERKKASRVILEDSIRKEMAAKEASQNAPDIDDTDDLDPEAEFDAWRLRELSRLARDKEARMIKEQEREEIERRRALPEAQRLAEDEAYARQTRQEKQEQLAATAGSRPVMEKFYHKGAFHQDDDILKRNYNVKTASSVDVNLLPKIMQVKNFGKASRSKYTNLKDQDTTQQGWDRALRHDPGGRRQPAVGGSGSNNTAQSGCFNCGGPHLKKDCPNPPPKREDDAASRTGGNREPFADRRGGYSRDEGYRSRGDGYRDKHDTRDTYRDTRDDSRGTSSSHRSRDDGYRRR